MLGYAITIMIVGTLTSLVGGWIKGPNWPRPVLIGLFLTFLGATAALMYVQISSPQPNDTSSPVATPTRIALSDKSPVRVWWLGQGDTIQIQWDPADSDEVHSYSVDIYGMAPIRNYYNLGYRIGEELRTSDTANPVAEMNEKLSDFGDSETVDYEETWRVCVTAYRYTPDPDVGPKIIQGTERCSDPFVIPKN